MHFYLHISKKIRTFAAQTAKYEKNMERFPYSIEELRASVEEGTRQVDEGRYYTDAQVTRMLKHRNLQLA